MRSMSLYMRHVRKLFVFIIAFALFSSIAISVRATGKTELDDAVNSAAAYILSVVKKPQTGSVGGVWAVLGLARSGYDVPDSFYHDYYNAVEEYVKSCDGVLHDRKYSEYSHVILGLTAAGFDPRDVAGYDLTKPLEDFDSTVWQGINGSVFALISLDSSDYPNSRRDDYIAEILRRQLGDGGWALASGAGGTFGTSYASGASSRFGVSGALSVSGVGSVSGVVDTSGSSGAGGTSGANNRSDPDITGMALQALAKYQHKPEVKSATDKALAFLSGVQDSDGGYSGWGSANSESAVQVLVALCELGIPIDDARFVKNSATLVDYILNLRNPDGSFRHSADASGNDQMSTEQVFYGLVAAQRAIEGKNSLYRMGDITKRYVTSTPPRGSGFPGKHPDVRAMIVSNPGKTFTDITNHPNQAAVESLAARGVINGMNEALFDPDATMTRAQFAAIVTRALALPEKTSSPFVDVSAEMWYTIPVATAHYYGIVNGVSSSLFNPKGTITRQEAAVITSRAAKLCGIDTARGETEIRDALAQFGDYRTVANWSQESMAFCYDTGILDDEVFDIMPMEAVKRCEVAEMLFRMLNMANLLEN